MTIAIVFGIAMLIVAVFNFAYKRGRTDGAREEKDSVVKILKLAIAVRNSPTAKIAMMRIAGDIDDVEMGDALDADNPYTHLKKIREKKER